MRVCITEHGVHFNTFNSINMKLCGAGVVGAWSPGGDPTGPSSSSGEEPSTVLLVTPFCMGKGAGGLMTPCADLLMFPTFSVKRLTSAPRRAELSHPSEPLLHFLQRDNLLSSLDGAETFA